MRRISLLDATPSAVKHSALIFLPPPSCRCIKGYLVALVLPAFAARPPPQRSHHFASPSGWGRGMSGRYRRLVGPAPGVWGDGALARPPPDEHGAVWSRAGL